METKDELKEMLDSDELKGFFFAGAKEEGLQILAQGAVPLFMLGLEVLRKAIDLSDADKRKEIAKTLCEGIMREADEPRSSSDEEADSEE